MTNQLLDLSRIYSMTADMASLLAAPDIRERIHRLRAQESAVYLETQVPYLMKGSILASRTQGSPSRERRMTCPPVHIFMICTLLMRKV